MLDEVGMHDASTTLQSHRRRATHFQDLPLNVCQKLSKYFIDEKDCISDGCREVLESLGLKEYLEDLTTLPRGFGKCVLLQLASDGITIRQLRNNLLEGDQDPELRPKITELVKVIDKEVRIMATEQVNLLILQTIHFY